MAFDRERMDGEDVFFACWAEGFFHFASSTNMSSYSSMTVSASSTMSVFSDKFSFDTRF